MELECPGCKTDLGKAITPLPLMVWTGSLVIGCPICECVIPMSIATDGTIYFKKEEDRPSLQGPPEEIRFGIKPEPPNKRGK